MAARDNEPWPWVAHAGLGGGLANILKRYNPTRAGFEYSVQTSTYVDADGRPIRIGDSPSAIARFGQPAETGEIIMMLGDLVAGESDEPMGPQGILVEDRGVSGVLDPNDVIISCFGVDGLPADRVQRLALGTLTGPVGIHIYRRDPGRAERMRNGRIKPDNPVWNLSPQRQWMTLAGVAIIIIVLLRRARMMKRRK